MRDPKKNESYDGPEDAKKIDIAEPGELSEEKILSQYISPQI